MKNLTGTITALVTPFKNENIDYRSLDRLIEIQLNSGVDGFVINGTTGESPTLTPQEVVELFTYVKKQVGTRATLILGTGLNNTVKTIEATKKAEDLGADAALVVVPYYNKPPQRGLYEHFKRVAETVKIPTILYNVPGRTITSLSVETILELSKVPGIVGIKEATGNIEFANEIIQACGKDFIMLSGDDGTYVEFLGVGGHGVISVASHIIPKQMAQWKSWVNSGQIEKAREDIKKYMNLINLLFTEANPIPVKMALNLLGIIDQPDLRLPLVKLSENNTTNLKTEMKKVGLL